MPKYNIKFPIAGSLSFLDVESENEKQAIEKCYELVQECEADEKNVLKEFDGEWSMYEKIVQGNGCNISPYCVDVEEVD